MNKTILITGGCGFVGINLCQKLKLKYPKCNVIAFDNLRRRGSELNIEKLKELNIEFVHGDIRNPEDFESIENVDVVIDASAEPSVVAGLNGGQSQLININLTGTINVLNVALKHNAQFIFLSTSRIFPIENINNIAYIEEQTRFQIAKEQVISGVSTKGIAENFDKEGYRSLYGASKLSSEHIIAEYNHFYNLPTIINRCGVLTGPHQMGKVDQGVVVLWLARHYWKKDLAYFGYGGEGKQVRDILHIDDLFDLIDNQINNFNLYNGKTFNVGGGQDSSVSLQELTRICEGVTGNKLSIKKVKEDRIADIRIYITDNTVINKLSGWQPKCTPTNIISDIFDWIKSDEQKLKKILN